jgi:hypothetical protein
VRFFVDFKHEKSTSHNKGEQAMTVASSTLTNALPHILRIKASTVDASYVALRDSELVPKGSGPCPAELDSAQAAMVVLGILAPGPVRMTAQLAKLYYGLRDPEGRKAGDAIAALIDGFMHQDPRVVKLTYRSHVTIDFDAARITVAHPYNDETGDIIETVYGEREPKGFEPHVTRSARISGKCLFNISALIHADKFKKRDQRQRQRAVHTHSSQANV